ncbi:pleckstrin homology domain-containing family A member 8 [Engraulis encrasicolus]|uniref:pleckstrin homology domain-containing family A member 8 n=1 Tax=Engraulis encrasicolus TaxID=184585 RepID=UPI002FD6AD47
MEGVLYKWTNYISGWQPRWFVLDGGTLSYYDSQEEAWKGCKGSIKISVCEIQVHPSDVLRVDLLIPGEQYFYLRSINAADRQKWLVALGTAKACLTDHRTRREKELQENSAALKTKVCELRLYCDLLLQQVNNIQDNPHTHTEVKSTCSTFLKTLEECMLIAGRTFTPDLLTLSPPASPPITTAKQHKVKPINQTSPHQGHRKRETSSSSHSELIGPPPSPGQRPPDDTEHSLQPDTPPAEDQSCDAVMEEETAESTEHAHADDITHNQVEGGASGDDITHNQEEGGASGDDITHNQEVPAVSSESNQKEGGASGDDITHNQEEGGDNQPTNQQAGQAAEEEPEEDGQSACEEEETVQSEGSDEKGAGSVQTFFSSMSHRFSDITLEEDSGIPTQAFLDSCYAIVPVLDKLGPTVFAPVKIDFVGNIKKIQQKFQSDVPSFPTLQSIVLHEIHTQQAQVRNSATEALLWLKRGLHFLLEFLQQVNTGEQDIHTALNNAYGRTLRQYHGWVVRGVFALALRAAPSYSAFAAALVVQEEAEPDVVSSWGEEQWAEFSAGVRRDLGIYLPAMKNQLGILDTLYHTHSLDSDEVV